MHAYLPFLLAACLIERAPQGVFLVFWIKANSGRLITQAPKLGYSKNDLKLSHRNYQKCNVISEADAKPCIISIETSRLSQLLLA